MDWLHNPKTVVERAMVVSPILSARVTPSASERQIDLLAHESHGADEIFVGRAYTRQA